MFLDGERWQAFFDSFEREAFRLETLPVYRVPQEAEMFTRFVQEGQLPTAEDTKDWTERLQRLAVQGKRVGRVHVLTQPLTDYLRFEFGHYQYNVEAGEDIRILDHTGQPDPGLPHQDFWMFDESQVVLMHYAPNGTQTSRELIDGDPAPYVEFKRRAIALSVPFLEYVQH